MLIARIIPFGRSSSSSSNACPTSNTVVPRALELRLFLLVAACSAVSSHQKVRQHIRGNEDTLRLVSKSAMVSELLAERVVEAVLALEFLRLCWFRKFGL